MRLSWRSRCQLDDLSPFKGIALSHTTLRFSSRLWSVQSVKSVVSIILFPYPTATDSFFLIAKGAREERLEEEVLALARLRLLNAAETRTVSAARIW
jgi:hypothetical protein